MSKRLLFVIAAVALLGGGMLYRASSAHSARTQADQIVSADLAAQDITSRLTQLKTFVRDHMGASVSFTLKGSYDRAISAAQAQAATPDPNARVYAAAQAACAGKSDSITQAKCNQAYLAQHLVTVPTPVPVAAPAPSSYRYALQSPAWTADLAGALLLGALLALGFAVVSGRRPGRR